MPRPGAASRDREARARDTCAHRGAYRAKLGNTPTIQRLYALCARAGY